MEATGFIPTTLHLQISLIITALKNKKTNQLNKCAVLFGWKENLLGINSTKLKFSGMEKPCEVNPIVNQSENQCCIRKHLGLCP